MEFQVSLFNVIGALNDALHIKQLHSFSVKFYELDTAAGYMPNTFAAFIATDDLSSMSVKYLNWYGKLVDYVGFQKEPIFATPDILIGLEVYANGNIYIADYVTNNFLKSLNRYTRYGIQDIEQTMTDYLRIDKLPVGNTSKDTCHHAWQSYTGLQRTFEFCTKCDLKR